MTAIEFITANWFIIGWFVAPALGLLVWGTLLKRSEFWFFPSFALPILSWLIISLIINGYQIHNAAIQTVGIIYDNGTAILNNGTAIRFQVIP